MQRIKFLLGEERHVRIRIHSANGESFAIREASFELKYGAQLEDSGDCMIDGDVIDALIVPQRITSYKLYFKYHVADEVLMECIQVDVDG